MDEAVSLFSGGVFNGLELNTRETGQDSLCHSDKMWPDTPSTSLPVCSRLLSTEHSKTMNSFYK